MFVVRSYERESDVINRITCTAYAAMPVQLNCGADRLLADAGSTRSHLGRSRLPVLLGYPTLGPFFPGFGTRPFVTEDRRRLGPQGFSQKSY